MVGSFRGPAAERRAAGICVLDHHGGMLGQVVDRGDGAVEVRHPSLEEIYVGYMQGERTNQSDA